MTEASSDYDAALAQLFAAEAAFLANTLPMRSQEDLLAIVRVEHEMQSGYTQVLTDLVEEPNRTKYSCWGFQISGTNPQTKEEAVIAKTLVPKQLDPTNNPEYLAQLAAWTNTYMLVTSPMTRAAWRALGFTVNFFQAPAPSKEPRLTLVKP